VVKVLTHEEFESVDKSLVSCGTGKTEFTSTAKKKKKQHLMWILKMQRRELSVFARAIKK